MSVTFALEELLAYSDHERRKWKDWIAADPSRLVMPFQPGGRFQTVWDLLDHLFLVERRHLSRMEGGVPPDATGVERGDWPALFEYADLVRADLREFLSDLAPAEAAAGITFTVSSGPLTISRQKLALHIAIHEVRHLAQLAYMARLAGQEPPGRHDYAFFPAPEELRQA